MQVDNAKKLEARKTEAESARESPQRKHMTAIRN
jgi:hypothetical protein